MDTTDSTPLKRCYACGCEYPADRDHFHALKKSRDGLKSICKGCNCAKSREWNAANKERAAATGKAWYEANREKMVAYKRDWKKANRERLAVEAKIWYAENREGVRIRRKRWYDANADHARAYTKAWVAANPERARDNSSVSGRRRRARKAGNGGNHTVADLSAIRAAQTDKQGRLICWRCGKPIKGTPELDHWIPIKHGGRNDAGNLHYMHEACNRSKGAKLPNEIGRLL